jgi:hypothetical protein
MNRLVTTHYRYKPPPRKKGTPLAGPAIVTKRARKPKVAPATARPQVNDDRKAAPPSVAGKKPAIVTTTSRKLTKQLRAERAPVDEGDAEADAAMRAWLERAKWGRGPAA